MENSVDDYGELLSKTAMKDRRAFEKLYQITSSKLFGVLLRIVKREDLAQECLQDAYVLIWNRAADFQAEKGQPLTWMVSIARYRALDLLRKRKHEVTLDDEMLSQEMDGSPDWVEERLIAAEGASGLANCLKELQNEQRNCLYLAYFEGYTHPEIAVRIDAPVGSVKTWIRRGMIRLKECLS
ncbi:MAG: sigma-70 family RNA polymerase sigma factor [Gammaproteobacteria bacterium]|jgi:RNA polymerase sigma-70 factor (ECF subfamily)|nr:sigma-70 family RNA polymerase sigma factor [Gammaproteobacteria bacterium]MBT3489485.1 sigma-70 family RNA polymerase sigma factor [Gammaproteobacteria bacterium]MBT3719608.1 sigma-70 family RNA polymerase sigma factor [Gammaproteobacteria bacterium]MBT3844114.1 sigma-70 family RNA polymerase sigma factor [Gammaproteobacteria bacterium]MBT3893678.1 sigma-70 family RNA polymerase sigma factor [Gammaproteobacteria bacterium]